MVTSDTASSKVVPGLWVGQLLHFGCLLVLLFLVSLAWVSLGKPHPALFWAAVATPILHQIFVWLAWRIELNTSALSQSIGFHGYLVVFFALFVGRFVSLAILAWYDRGNLNLSVPVQIVSTAVLAIPGVYAMYSVKRYFGMVRAAGADHFDERYRQMPLVNEGIFRFSRNGMYLYAFLLFWAIAIAFNSISAVVVAAFSHLYIWVHYYATEKPDMDFLYASESNE